ncbi:MAG: hypothetical protein ACRD2S_04710 [Terriglobales bacterium]
MRRVLPAISLFFIAPLVAEFLLGNLPITVLPALVILAPMYGGGALLIRETVRRTGRGWPSILMLGLAYGLFEEAFTTQSLFNPNYLHLNMGLLKPAYIHALGIGAWWTVFVLTIHAVWSISVSIGLAEALVPDRSTTPWLGRKGLIVTVVLFLVGAAGSTLITLKGDHFVASDTQLASAAVLCAALIALASAFHVRRSSRDPGYVPSPWIVGVSALVAGAVFLIVPNAWGWWAVALYLVLDCVATGAVFQWSRRRGWELPHRLALAAGAAFAYGLHAFTEHPVVGKNMTVARIGNVVFLLGLVVLVAVAWQRINRYKPEVPG